MAEELSRDRFCPRTPNPGVLHPGPHGHRGEEPPAQVMLRGWAGGCDGAVVEPGAAEDEEEPVVVTVVDGPFSVPPAGLCEMPWQAAPYPRATSHQRLQMPSDIRSWLAASGFFWNGQMWYLSNKGSFFFSC